MSRRGEIGAPARDVSVANLGGAGRHGSSHRLRIKLAARWPVVLLANNESPGVACGIRLARRSYAQVRRCAILHASSR